MKVKVKNTQRQDIQGLRAVAIILVILAHSGVSLFSGGFVGVDIFFVLSGYLITRLLVNEYSDRGTIQLSTFFARRLKRLLPSLLLMIVSVSLISLALLSNYEYLTQMSSSIYAITWMSNLFFAFSSIDYFAELQTRDLFLHTWSLGVEEQFYLVWPILLLSMLSYFNKKEKSIDLRKILLWFLSLCLILSFFLSLYWSYLYPLWSYYLMPSRMWQFALGGLIFIYFESSSNSIKKPSLKFSLILRYIGISLIIFSAVLIDNNMTYPGYLAIFPSFGVTLIIISGINNEEIKSKQSMLHLILC